MVRKSRRGAARSQESADGAVARSTTKEQPPGTDSALPRDSSRVSPYLHSKRKRAFDLVVSLAGVAVFATLLPFAGLAIYIDSRGPIFYSRERAGRDGIPFKMLKFRTMFQHETEDTASLRTQKADRRLTRVGKILRKTYIDEFPQFLNVLKGEMSVVGPRPEFQELHDELSKAREDFAKRLIAKPGVTGLAQVHYRHASNGKEASRRIYYDARYIKNASLQLDMLLVFKTVARALRLGGH